MHSSDRAKPTRAAFQISLGRFLIGLVGLGAGVGLLGRWLMRDPDLFRAAMYALSTAVPFLLATGTILRLAMRERRRGLVVWACALTLMPAVGFAVLLVANSYIGTAPGGLGILSNQTLINERLPNQVDEPWVWRELEARLARGELSQAEVDAALGRLASHLMSTRPQGWNQPLPWAKQFIAAAAAARGVSEATLVDLSDAFYGPPPQFEQIPRRRAGRPTMPMQIGSYQNWDSELPLRRIWSVEQVLLDGEPVDVRNSRLLRHGFSGAITAELAPGTHELTAKLACAYVTERQLRDVASGGAASGGLEQYRWPQNPVKEWSATASRKFRVYAPGEAIVTLSTDPADDPRSNGALRIGRLAVLPNRDGDGDEATVRLFIHCGDVLPAPVSFDVSATFGDQQAPLGSFRAVRSPDHSLTSGNELKASINGLDPEVTTADVLFTPNPAHVESIESVERIWGKPIVFPNVPIERFDSDGAKRLNGSAPARRT